MRSGWVIALTALLGSSVLGIAGVSQGFPSIKKAATQAQKGAQGASKHTAVKHGVKFNRYLFIGYDSFRLLAAATNAPDIVLHNRALR